jgi:hypothetical protein
MAKRKMLFLDKGEHGTVVLNWHGTPEEEFTYFAEAFHDVARKTAEDLGNNPHFGIHGIPVEDFKAYPVVFMYRHALELHMKAVILAGSPMLPPPKVDRVKLLKTHHLDILRQDVERVFDAYHWGWDLGVPHFETLDDFRYAIAELANVDAGSYAFRYPVDTKGKASLASHFRFNLFEFCEILDGLLKVLKGATIGAYEEFQAMAQAAAEEREADYEYADHDPDYPDFEPPGD